MESVLFPTPPLQERLALARALLKRRRGPEPVWPVVLSAAFFMVCALGFAAAAITAPPAKFAPVNKFTPVVEDAHPLVK